MGTATLSVPETQIIEWVIGLSPQAKLEILRRLIPHLDQAEMRIERGATRMRQIAVQRGLKPWDEMNEGEQAGLIDDVLHEP